MPGGNRSAYCPPINEELVRITGVSPKELVEYLAYCDELIKKCILANLTNLEEHRTLIINGIKNSVNRKNDTNELKQQIIEYKISSETKTLTDLINRINSFRL